MLNENIQILYTGYFVAALNKSSAFSKNFMARQFQCSIFLMRKISAYDFEYKTDRS